MKEKQISDSLYKLIGDTTGVLSEKIAQATIEISKAKPTFTAVADFALWAISETRRRDSNHQLYPDSCTTKQALCLYLQLAINITKSPLILKAVRSNLDLLPDNQSGGVLATVVDMSKFSLDLFDFNKSEHVRAGLLYSALKHAWNPVADQSYTNLREALHRYLKPSEGILRNATESLITRRPSFYHSIIVDAVGTERATKFSVALSIIDGKDSGRFEDIKRAFGFVIDNSDTFCEQWVYEIPEGILTQIISDMSKTLVNLNWGNGSHFTEYRRITPSFHGIANILECRKDVVENLSKDDDFAVFCGMCLVEHDCYSIDEHDFGIFYGHISMFGERFMELAKIIFAMNRGGRGYVY